MLRCERQIRILVIFSGISVKSNVPVVIIALTWTNGWLNRLKCAVMCHIEINEANNVKVPASCGREREGYTHRKGCLSVRATNESESKAHIPTKLPGKP